MEGRNSETKMEAQAARNVLAGLLEQEERLKRAGDGRAIFATAYVITTKEILAAIEAGEFDDSILASNYVFEFAKAYHDAFDAFESGSGRAESWALAFETALRPTTSVPQKLLLGINAHINYDLALVLLKSGFDLQSTAHLACHQKIDDALSSAMTRVRRIIVRTYLPHEWLRSTILGPGLDRLADAAFRRARTRAWETASRFSEVSPMELDSLRIEHDRLAAARGRSILAAKDHPRACFRLLASPPEPSSVRQPPAAQPTATFS